MKKTKTKKENEEAEISITYLNQLIAEHHVEKIEVHERDVYLVSEGDQSVLYAVEKGSHTASRIVAYNRSLEENF